MLPLSDGDEDVDEKCNVKHCSNQKQGDVLNCFQHFGSVRNIDERENCWKQENNGG